VELLVDDFLAGVLVAGDAQRAVDAGDIWISMSRLPDMMPGKRGLP